MFYYFNQKTENSKFTSVNKNFRVEKFRHLKELKNCSNKNVLKAEVAFCRNKEFSEIARKKSQSLKNPRFASIEISNSGNIPNILGAVRSRIEKNNKISQNSEFESLIERIVSFGSVWEWSDESSQKYQKWTKRRSRVKLKKTCRFCGPIRNLRWKLSQKIFHVSSAILAIFVISNDQLSLHKSTKNARNVAHGFKWKKKC